MPSNRRQRKHPSNRTVWTSKGHTSTQRTRARHWNENFSTLTNTFRRRFLNGRTRVQHLRLYSTRKRKRVGGGEFVALNQFDATISCAFSVFRFLMSTKLLKIDNRVLSPLSLVRIWKRERKSAQSLVSVCVALRSHPLPNRNHWQKEDIKWKERKAKRQRRVRTRCYIVLSVSEELFSLFITIFHRWISFRFYGPIFTCLKICLLQFCSQSLSPFSWLLFECECGTVCFFCSRN